MKQAVKQTPFILCMMKETVCRFHSIE